MCSNIIFHLKHLCLQGGQVGVLSLLEFGIGFFYTNLFNHISKILRVRVLNVDAVVPRWNTIYKRNTWRYSDGNVGESVPGGSVEIRWDCGTLLHLKQCDLGVLGPIQRPGNSKLPHQWPVSYRLVFNFIKIERKWASATRFTRLSSVSGSNPALFSLTRSFAPTSRAYSCSLYFLIPWPRVQYNTIGRFMRDTTADQPNDLSDQGWYLYFCLFVSLFQFLGAYLFI